MSLDLLINQLLETIQGKLAHELSQHTPRRASPEISHDRDSLPPLQKEEGPNLTQSSKERLTHKTLASKIDHTLLKADATPDEIQQICREAREHHFASVCVNSGYIEWVAKLLRGCDTRAIAVVGFPLGATTTATKAFEAAQAVRLGAQEIDMVIALGALKSGDYALVFDDIFQVVKVSQPFPVKVILETSLLTQEQKIMGCALAKAAGAAFVKTSTGFNGSRATLEDVALMRRIVGPEMGVKASGGIRTFEDATQMIEAGASRIGASASVAMVTQEASLPQILNPDSPNSKTQKNKGNLYSSK